MSFSLRTPLGLLGCGLLVLIAGCGEAEEPKYEVTGVVQYDGTPVTEGTILFEDLTTGAAVSTPLTSEGKYEVELPKGNYKVTVTPPTVEIPATANSPASETWKQVKNIPDNVRHIESSHLSAEVNSDMTEYDFELKNPTRRL